MPIVAIVLTRDCLGVSDSADNIGSARERKYVRQPLFLSSFRLILSRDKREIFGLFSIFFCLLLIRDKHNLYCWGDGLNSPTYQGWIIGLSSSGSLQESRAGLGSTLSSSSGTSLEFWTLKHVVNHILAGYTQGCMSVLVSPETCLGSRSGLGSNTTSLSGTCLGSWTWWLASVTTSSLAIKLDR